MPSTKISLRTLENYVFSNAAYTLVSQTALQKIFNASATGAVRVEPATAYFFECSFSLSAMSAVAGTFGFGFLGTATITSLSYTALSDKADALGAPSTGQIIVGNVSTALQLVSSSVITTGNTLIKGIIRVNAGGTLIPSVNVSVAAAAIVGVNSFFRIVPIGTNTQTNVGLWT